MPIGCLGHIVWVIVLGFAGMRPKDSGINVKLEEGIVNCCAKWETCASIDYKSIASNGNDG